MLRGPQDAPHLPAPGPPRKQLYDKKHWETYAGIYKFDGVFRDKLPHLFTLVLTPDNHFEVLVNRRSEVKGGVNPRPKAALGNFEPAVNPPAEVEDPMDVRPAWMSIRQTGTSGKRCLIK